MKMMNRGLLAVVSVCLWAAAQAVPMQLYLMKDAAARGAVCLDGTPAGYYFAPAATAATNASWQIYFQGGGWCYSAVDCWGRSQTKLGSSKNWPDTIGSGGVMSDDCDINPDFCNYNRVYMPYCDGNSFSGNRDEPIVVNGANIYFRGHRILNEIISSLYNMHNFDAAQQVLLTGCSAGGLATFMHTDYVATLLPPSVTRYGAIPISGFFLLHNNVVGEPIYPDEMQVIYQLSNATEGTNQACIADHDPEDQWKCNFAQEVYAYTQSPIFPLNSAYDSWQAVCIFTAEPVVPANSTINGNCSATPGWSSCVNRADHCTDAQVVQYNQYAQDFVSTMQNIETNSRQGNGAFIYSCETHCAAEDNHAFTTFAVDGVTMQQAVSAWWNSGFTDPAAKHTYWPCYFNVNSVPRQCNPTCEGSHF